MDINSDQGIRLICHQVQKWSDKNDIQWLFHLPYNPTAAGLIERVNGLLKKQLRWETHSQHVDASQEQCPSACTMLTQRKVVNTIRVQLSVAIYQLGQ